MIERSVRGFAYLGFGVWLVVHTLAVPGFVWLHAAFLTFAVTVAACGALVLLGRTDPGGRVLAVAVAGLGLLLLGVSGSPFGLLALALGLQLFPRTASRPAPGAVGNGPAGV